MSLRGQFLTDPEKENNGVPITFGMNEDGTVPTFIIARTGTNNKAYAKDVERRFKPYTRQIQLKTMDKNKLIDLALDTFVATVLKGWSNVKMSDITGDARDTGDAPFNPVHAKNLLVALPDLYAELEAQANDAANFRDGLMEESAKN